MVLASLQCTCSLGNVFEGVLATKQITVLEHPAYSPDLAPSDFFLFPKIKEILKGRHFDDIGNNTMAAPKERFQESWYLDLQVQGWLGPAVEVTKIAQLVRSSNAKT